jgi:hypothetical protein
MRKWGYISDVSGKHAASIVISPHKYQLPNTPRFGPDDGDSMFLRHIGNSHFQMVTALTSIMNIARFYLFVLT